MIKSNELTLIYSVVTIPFIYHKEVTGNGLTNGLCQYEYDAFGRRVKKHVGNVQTVFISDGHQVVAEYSKQGGQALALIKNMFMLHILMISSLKSSLVHQFTTTVIVNSM